MINAHGKVTEGSSANAWMVSRDAASGRVVLRTHLADRHVLNGIVRTALVALAGQHQWQIEERAFTLDELLAADEAFQTSSGNMIRSVRSVDGRVIGTGEPGPVVQEILDGFAAHVAEQCRV
jgi:D-alanine transaminase